MGAGEGNRTLAPSLGSSCSTIELHPQVLAESTKANGSGEDCYCSPDRHQHPYRDEKANPSWPIGGLLYPFGRLAASVLPPSETVAEEKGEAESHDQLGEEVLNVKNVGHKVTVTLDRLNP